LFLSFDSPIVGLYFLLTGRQYPVAKQERYLVVGKRLVPFVGRENSKMVDYPKALTLLEVYLSE
jgi:hypothetical protein